MAYQKGEEKKKETSTFAIVLTFIIVIFILIVLVPLTIPKKQANLDKSSCLTDSDCVCGGIDKLANSCFIGNKAYYDLYVDKSLQCPDFCSGIGNNLQAKCVNKACTQVAGMPRECDFDIDCVKVGLGDKCSDGTCTYRTRPTGAGTECAQDSDCVAKNLGNRCSRGVCTGLKPECTTDQDCINQGLGNSCGMGRCSIKNLTTPCSKDSDCPFIAAPCICSGGYNSCPTNKCISNKCAIVNNCPGEAECASNSDCVPSTCCHATSCVPVSQKQNCSGTVCSPSCQPGTLDCGQGACICTPKKKCLALLVQNSSNNSSGISQTGSQQD